MSKARVIAFYLPQFHPFKENDEWWGKGFTEWTNVAKAKPLFKGHYQPKIPADLGFYDLRVPEVREAQACLAREAGIEGFCYWHYWFEGHELMERPFWEVVNSGKPDFPFCIGWANETWKSKMWNKDGSLAKGTKVLIEQKYSEEDDIAHFNKLLPVFKDHRYITVDNKPLVFIQCGSDLPTHTIEIWNKKAIESGFPGIHFVGRITADEYVKYGNKAIEKMLNLGYNAVTISRIGLSFKMDSYLTRLIKKVECIIMYGGCRHVVKYSDELKHFINDQEDTLDYVYPAIYPNFDHSPRSGNRGTIYIGSTPVIWGKYVKKIFQIISRKDRQHQIVFLKSWNEWGEGNYIEPDLKWGKQYLEELKRIIKDFQR